MHLCATLMVGDVGLIVSSTQALVDERVNGIRARLGGEIRFRRSRVPVGTLWPNGQFSVGYQFRTERDEVRIKDEWAWLPGSAPGGNLVSTLKFSQDKIEVPEAAQKKRGKYGLKGITTYGTRMVKNAAFLMEEKFGARGLAFWTLTIPQLGEAERVRVARRWGEIARQTTQWFQRQLTRAGLAGWFVSVTEIQTRRLERSGQAYLHLHAVAPAHVPGQKGFSVDVARARTFFTSLVERIAGVDVDGYARVNAQIVRKSAQNYLGKYMSKGAGDIRKAADDLGEDSVPGQWWSITAWMRARVKSRQVKGERVGAELDLLFHVNLEAEVWEFPGVCFPIILPRGDDFFLAGVYGKISSDVVPLLSSA